MDSVSPNFIINSPQESDRVSMLSQIQKLKNEKGKKKNPISESGRHIIFQRKSLVSIYSCRLLSSGLLFKLRTLMISHPEINKPKAAQIQKRHWLSYFIQEVPISGCPACSLQRLWLMTHYSILRVTRVLGRRSGVCREAINLRWNILFVEASVHAI